MKLTHVRPLNFVLIALWIIASMILAACGSEPAPEPAEAEVPAAEVQPTEVPPTELPQSEFALEDDFADNSNDWELVTEKTDYGYSDQIQDGQLVMSFEQESWNAKSLPVELSNVDMSFDVTLIEGMPSNASFGALCRATDNDNYYILRLDGGGGYYMMGKMVNGEWEVPIEWTQSAVIKLGVGETNRVRVVCSDSDFELYANDQLLFKTQDTSLTTGEAALMASRFDEDDALVLVAFDNLEAKVPAGILLSESFENNGHKWQLNEDETGSAQIKDGQLVVAVNEQSAWQWAPQDAPSSDVDISFDVTLAEGTPDNAGYGVACRLSEDANNYYDFIMASNGIYGLDKVVDGSLETLIEFSETTAIKQGIGVTNRFRVVCSGSNLGLYANGEEVFMLQDTSITTGDLFALEAGMYMVDETPILVEFDNVVVK